MLRKALLAGGAVAILGAVTVSAHAGVITDNVWYSASFTTTGSGFFPAFALGTNPPAFRPFGSADAGSGPYTITLANPEWLLITDLEISGDRFSLAFTGATTGTLTTTAPCAGCSSVGENISAALANNDYSRGYFLLNAGVTTITPTFLGTINNGDVAFSVASAVPEASTWAMMLLGFAGLGFAGYRASRKTANLAV